MAIMRLLFVVFVLAGCRQASEGDTQNTPKKEDAVKQNNKTETVSVGTPIAQPAEPVSTEPLAGPPVEVIDVPVPVPVPGYAGFPRTFGSGGPGRKLPKCKGPECVGFITLNEDCGGFVEVADDCAGFITSTN